MCNCGVQKLASELHGWVVYDNELHTVCDAGLLDEFSFTIEQINLLYLRCFSSQV